MVKEVHVHTQHIQRVHIMYKQAKQNTYLKRDPKKNKNKGLCNMYAQVTLLCQQQRD